MARSEAGEPSFLPVLACYRRSPQQIDTYGAENRVCYPWFPIDLDEGLSKLRDEQYGRFVLEASTPEAPPGEHWSFHRSFVAAWRSGDLERHGLAEAGRFSIGGRTFIVFQEREP